LDSKILCSHQYAPTFSVVQSPASRVQVTCLQVTRHQVNKSISSLLSADGSLASSVGLHPLPALFEFGAVGGVLLVGDNADDVSVW